MKRFIFAVVILVLLASTAFCDIPDPRRFRRPPLPIPNNRTKFEFFPQEDKERALTFKMTVYGAGVYSYSFSEKESGRNLDSEKNNTDASETSIGRTWSFAIPESGKKIHYNLQASFTPAGGRAERFTRNITVSNVKGVIYVVIN